MALGKDLGMYPLHTALPMRIPALSGENSTEIGSISLEYKDWVGTLGQSFGGRLKIGADAGLKWRGQI